MGGIPARISQAENGTLPELKKNTQLLAAQLSDPAGRKLGARPPANEHFVPEFVAKFIHSPIGKTYFQEVSKQTANLASINQRQLKDFKVFQPPLAEQHRIAAELDALPAKVDALKRLQAETGAS